MNKNIKIKRILCIMAMIFSIIYLLWRAFFTLPFGYGIISIISGTFLFLAELIGIISGTEQLVVVDKSCMVQCPKISGERYPHIDVLIATHNEPKELLYKTINGCQNMSYPDKQKVHIYICDDGNREEIRSLADSMNVNYFGFSDNKLAKAGNLNNALGKTDSPLVATFDADMIPLSTFLIDTVPFFFMPESTDNDNPKIGFIQTPQSFYNADLFQYNLYSEDRVPNEQNFFFREINIVRNRTNTPIYAGSNTLISRQALNDVGGIATGLITEDFATGIRIQKKGYRCFATDKVEANGLAPNDIKSLIKQRERWARGCIQSLKKEHILLTRELKLSQKISYFNSQLYWYNPLCRFIYVLSPILFGLFGIYVLKYSFINMLYIWLPYFILYNLAIKLASGNIRNSRLSNVYDTILSPYLIIPVILESIGIKKKKFVVTKKDNSMVGNLSYKYVIPHIIMAMLSVFALIRCINIAINSQSPYYIVIICWLIFNLYSIIMSIFFLLGRKIERNVERLKVKIDVKILCKYSILVGHTIDISDNGLGVLFDFPDYIDDDEVVTIQCKTDKYFSEFKASVVYFTNMGDKFKYAFVIKEIDDENKRNYLNIIYDREPTLPEVIHENASVFGELSSNIHKRFAAYTKNSRRLARISIDRKMYTTEGKKVILYNFNYEYMLIGYKKNVQQNKISIDCENGIVITGEIESRKEFVTADGNVAVLYKVTNLPEFIQNDNFRQLLNCWINDYRKREELYREKRKLIEKSNIDEFDEIEYIWNLEEIKSQNGGKGDNK